MCIILRNVYANELMNSMGFPVSHKEIILYFF
jgi:hypothetical protein